MPVNSSNNPQVMSLMLRLAGYIEDPYSYGSRIMGEVTRIIPEGSAVDGKPTAYVQLVVPPQDGSARFFEVAAPPKPEVIGRPVSQNTVLPSSAESTGDKEFMQTPWIKPPRREPFNESDTRGWRRDYQKEYRSEHGNIS